MESIHLTEILVCTSNSTWDKLTCLHSPSPTACLSSRMSALTWDTGETTAPRHTLAGNPTEPNTFMPEPYCFSYLHLSLHPRHFLCLDNNCYLSTRRSTLTRDKGSSPKKRHHCLPTSRPYLTHITEFYLLPKRPDSVRDTLAS